MTLLKGNNYKEINVALLSLEADIKKLSNNGSFDTSAIDKQLAEINSRIDKINAGGNNTSAAINDIRYEIEDINSKLKGNSAKIEKIEQKLSEIFSAENKVTDFNTTTNSGIYYWVDDAANKPTDYGVLLVNKYDGGSNSIWINQVAYGTDNKIYFRQNINSGRWTEWKAVAFDGEITAKKVANALTVNGKTYDGSEAVDAGVQKIENGGTGVTTQADINKAFIGNLDTGESDVTDGTEFVSSYASDNGFAETANGALNKPYKRQFIKVWNYIKGKISSVLGLTKDNYGGKAATATNADTVDNYHANQLWRSDGATWNPGANVSLNAKANGDEWSFDFRNKNGATGLYWQVWDENKQTLLKVNADDGKVSAPYGFVGNLSGKADTAGSADRARNMYYQNLDLSSLDKTKFYPLVCYSANNFAEVAICSESGMDSAEYNQNRIHFDISTMGWSDLPSTLNIREYTCYQNNEITIGCIGRGLHNGAWAIWLRGGLHYTCFSRNADLSLKTSDYTYGDETYTVGTNYYGGSNTNVGVMFTPQSTITEGAYSTRPITAPNIKANNRLVIPIGAPSQLEDGCIWIER